jgi:hypothetical protein
MDSYWFREALDEGAEIFISPDWDIAVMAGNANKAFIQLPQNLGGGRLVEYVVNRVAKIAKVYKLNKTYIEVLA